MPRPSQDPIAGLGAARTPEGLRSALEAARGAGVSPEEIGAALAERYAHLSNEGQRRDPGAILRTELIRLLDLSGAHNVAVYRKAVRTHERMPPTNTEVAAPLRAAALAALTNADPEIAGYEAHLRLSDADSMTGEPARTAVRALGALGLPQALHALALSDAQDDLIAEALPCLSGLPLLLATELIDHLDESGRLNSPVVLVGLVDLVITHRDSLQLRPRLLELLGATRSVDAVRYAATLAVANRDRELFDAIVSASSRNGDRARAQMLDEVALLW